MVKYSRSLFAQIPIKHLLQIAEKNQEHFGYIYPQLLKFCAIQFPHLCLVQVQLLYDQNRLKSWSQISPNLATAFTKFGHSVLQDWFTEEHEISRVDSSTFSMAAFRKIDISETNFGKELDEAFTVCRVASFCKNST